MGFVRLAAFASVGAVIIAGVGCATAHDSTPAPLVVVPTAIVDVPPLEEPVAGAITACPPGSHPVIDLCVADGPPIPKWEPRGNGDPCAAWNRPELGLENCDPQNEGDPDMDHERGAIIRTLADTKVDIAKCKTPRGPHGAGHVEITYAMDGQATSARVVGAPYEGTPSGACIAARFRAVKAPAFKKKPTITVVTPFSLD